MGDVVVACLIVSLSKRHTGVHQFSAFQKAPFEGFYMQGLKSLNVFVWYVCMHVSAVLRCYKIRQHVEWFLPINHEMLVSHSHIQVASYNI